MNKVSCRVFVCGKFLAGLATLFAVGTAVAADYHWTGAAGDHRWSTAGNWTDSDGNPKAAPQDGVAYSYNFTNFADGEVVTQDINVVTSLFAVKNETGDKKERTITWVSASGKTFRLDGTSQIYGSRDVRLVLECDMSTDYSSGSITKINGGILVFKLKKANAASRMITDICNQGLYSRTEFDEAGATPRMGVSVGGGSVFRNGKEGTQTSALYVGKVDDGIYSLGRVETPGKTLIVGSSYAGTSSTNALPIPVFAQDGTLEVRCERVLMGYSLPIGGTLRLDRGDYIVDEHPMTAIRWLFDSPDDPTQDFVGVGYRMLAPKGMPDVVADPVRGNVIKFAGGKYFKGPDADAGLFGLQCQRTNAAYGVAFWYKPDASCDKLAKLIFWGENVANKALALRLNVGNNPSKPFMVTPWGDNSEVSCDTDPFDGDWHHLAVTYDGKNTLFVYSDGKEVLKRTNLDNYYPRNKNFYIGSIYGGWVSEGQNPYTGLMDDVLVAGYQLLPENVTALYTDGLRRTIGVGSVAAVGSGKASLSADRNASIGTLSGEGLSGGVEMRGEGRTLEVGADEASGEETFQARLFGGPSTLRKIGADYTQVLSGSAENVTNIDVKAGTLVVRRPLVRKGEIVNCSFDAADDLCHDSGAAGLVLTASGGTPVAVADGVSGGAIRFAGGTYLDSGTDGMPAGFPQLNDSYTISVWIRPTAETCAAKAPFVCWGKDDDRRLSYLRFESATELRFSNWGEDLPVTGLANLADGAWHHVVAVYDAVNTTKRVYVDGVLKAEKTTVSVLNIPGNWPLHLAHGCVNETTYAGDLDEFRVINAAWTEQEVRDAYALKELPVESAENELPRPVAHWTFDDADDPGKDVSGHGVDLTWATGTDGESPVVSDVELTCGKAWCSGNEKGYFSLPTLPSSFPSGNKLVSIVCRCLPERAQQSDSYATLLTWGDAGGWGDGKLIKFGFDWGSGGFRYTIGGRSGDPHMESTFRTQMGTTRQRWLTVALTYLPYSGAKGVYGGFFCYYCDGKLVGRVEVAADDLASQDFAIGAMATGASHFRGLVDDVQIYDRTLSAREVRLISEKLATSDGAAAPKVLPCRPSVSVAQDALFAVAADETVGTVSGEGRVEIAEFGSLSVAGLADFCGSFGGAGTLVIPDGAVLTVDDVARLPLAAMSGTISLGANVTVNLAQKNSERVTLLTAEGGLVGGENLSTWNVCYPRGKTGAVRLSADGKSVVLEPYRRGLMVIVR